MHYVYVVRSRISKRLYTGYTADLRKRFSQHRTDEGGYTKKRGYTDLVYYEACLNGHDSRAREVFLKSGPGKRYLNNRLKRFLFLTG